MNVFLWEQRQDRFLIISQKLEVVSRSRQWTQYLSSQYLEIQDSILAGEINEGQARVILQKNTTQARIALWKRILKEKMSVRKVEASVSKQSKWQRELENIQNKISRVIGVKVTIKKSKKTGKGYLKIYFDSKTWDRVLESLGVVTSWESDK